MAHSSYHQLPYSSSVALISLFVLSPQTMLGAQEKTAFRRRYSCPMNESFYRGWFCTTFYSHLQPGGGGSDCSVLPGTFVLPFFPRSSSGSSTQQQQQQRLGHGCCGCSWNDSPSKEYAICNVMFYYMPRLEIVIVSSLVLGMCFFPGI